MAFISCHPLKHCGKLDLMQSKKEERARSIRTYSRSSMRLTLLRLLSIDYDNAEPLSVSPHFDGKVSQTSGSYG
jgi:hypothetical protein